jgi:phosphopantothenoylcysteine decarboxylase / phosphopantothenate---cysteine ligase
MNVLITAGPTHEPIDAVRFIGNRSSGQMGAALASAALNAGHQVTLVLGPVTAMMPLGPRRIDVETAAQMLQAVLEEFPRHDLLIMAAAVADYRPIIALPNKLARDGNLLIECHATEDIVAAAGLIKRTDQRTVGFSLEAGANIARSREKLIDKKLDLIVYNPIATISSATIESILLWPDGRTEELPARPKSQFAAELIERAASLFG